MARKGRYLSCTWHARMGIWAGPIILGGVVQERRHLLLEALAWWVALFLIYLSLLASVTAVEIIIGAAIAVLGGVLAVLARQAEWAIFRFRLRWIGWLPALLAALFADTATLVVLVARTIRGLPAKETRRVHRLRLPPESRLHVARTRRAIVTVLLSLSPGTYVIDTRPRDDGADEFILHRVGRRQRLAREIAR